MMIFATAYANNTTTLEAGTYSIILNMPFPITQIIDDEPAKGETFGGTNYTEYGTHVISEYTNERNETQYAYLSLDVTIYDKKMKATQKWLKESAKDGRPNCKSTEYHERAIAGIPGMLGVNHYRYKSLLPPYETIEDERYIAAWWIDYDSANETGTTFANLYSECPWDLTSKILRGLQISRRET